MNTLPPFLDNPVISFLLCLFLIGLVNSLVMAWSILLGGHPCCKRYPWMPLRMSCKEQISSPFSAGSIDDSLLITPLASAQATVDDSPELACSKGTSSVSVILLCKICNL